MPKGVQGFIPGVSGNPNGRPKLSSTFAEVHREILNSDNIKIKFTVTKDGKKTEREIDIKANGKNFYHALTAVKIAEGLNGNMQAITSLEDRVDGKSNQSIDMTSLGEKLSTAPTFTIVDPTMQDDITKLHDEANFGRTIESEIN